MAQAPQQHSPPKSANHEPPKASKSEVSAHDDMGDAPDPIITLPEEQRARSAEIEAMGIDNWKAAHDDRNQTKAAKAEKDG